MLSIFPDALAFQGFAPMLLRLVLGAVMFFWGYTKLRQKGNKKEVAFGAIDGVVGIFLIVGILTQVASLIAVIILGGRLWKKIEQKAFLTDGVNYYLILLVIALSLILTGPGYFAFDLPL